MPLWAQQDLQGMLHSMVPGYHKTPQSSLKDNLALLMLFIYFKLFYFIFFSFYKYLCFHVLQAQMGWLRSRGNKPICISQHSDPGGIVKGSASTCERFVSAQTPLNT